MTATPTRPLVQGLVAGTRKAGTTWLYENFRRDPALSVSEQVKESGYFAGNGPSTPEAYEALFDQSEQGYVIEVDTSVCYAPDACDRIMRYNPQMRVALVFRNPADYLKSRHRHSLRKGELREENPLDALRANSWLMAELDYPAIVRQFAPLAERGQLSIFDYSDLENSQARFYREICDALGVPNRGDYLPFSERVNVARNSRLPLASRLLADGAKTARKLGLHGLVNRLKATNILTHLEQKVDPVGSPTVDALNDELQQLCPQSFEFYASLRSQ